MEIVRITSGKYRGRVLKTPGGATHPMGSREKLALFNMVAGHLPGALVLDAFAGSGALGLEALSRGADSVVFVEKSAAVARIIKENVANLGMQNFCEVFVSDIATFQPEGKFDVILADPPYDNFEAEKLESLPGFLAENGVLVLSHPGEAPELPGLELGKTHKYAGAKISVYSR